MKSKFYLPLIAIAMGLGSCTNDLVDETNPLMGKHDVIAVSVDNADTRTAMVDYNVVWSEDDAIGIFVGSTNNEYGLISDAGTTSGDFQSKGLVVASAETLKEAAYFPYVSTAAWNSSTKTITTSLPATYEYAEGTNNNAVMAALMAEDAQSSISFQNAGALYAITVENIPAGYDKAVMTYLDAEDNVGIAGAATITFVDEVPTLAVPDAASAQKTITITFTGTDDKTFYFPMPVKASGYANKLQFSLQGEGKGAITAPVFTKEPVRSNLYAVTLKLDAVSGGIVSEANDIEAANAALANDAVTSVAVKDVSGTEPITIPAKSESADVPHTIDLSEAELPTGDNKLTINVDNTTDNTTVKELTVVVPDEETAGNLVIDAPGTTVTIQGADGTVIETIEAITAENTLIIGEGVTIKNLTIKKGNVVLKGNVESIESEVNTTITLGKNITLANAMKVFKGNVTIDLNGYTIENKSANNTTQLGNVADECIVFYVDGADANLTLNATNGGKVIATGDGSTSYYNTAVWVTNGATATINGGEYSNTADPENDGCDLIYGRDGGKIYVTGGTFKAGAIRKTLGGGIYGVLNCKDTKGSVITVSGGKFYEYGAAEAAKVGNGEVILLEGGYYWSAKDADGYYTVTDKIETEEALRTAIANNNEVKLAANITLTDAITINKTVTIDLNGYTIENKTANNTTQLGNAADECIVFYVDGAEANLTLNATNGGKVIATGDGTTSFYNVAVWVTNGATTTINGGEYSNTADPENDGCDLIYGRDGGKIYVKGGIFKAGAIRKTLGGGIYGVLNCKDSKGSVITVSGGKFYEYGAAEAAKVGNGEVILLEGGYYWSAKDAEGYYTVTDKIETEEALKSAIANTSNVKLGANITLTDAITISKAVTIDLNGYTIENKSANNTTQLGNVADECIVFYVDGAEANLTLNATNGGKVIATGDGSTSYYNTAVWVTNGATTTINGGEYSNTADPEGDGCDLIYGRDGGKIYVKGGMFKAGAIRKTLGGGIYGVLNCKDSKGSVITVSGGNFYEYGAAEAAKVGNGEVILLEGGYYWSAKDAEGYYSVVKDNN